LTLAATKTELSRGRVALAMGAVALLMLGLAMVTRLNHDESQYFAAAELAARWQPFVDFLHLQTPYQIYVAAPIAALSDEYSLLMLRAFNSVMGVATIALVYACQRLLDVERRTALLVSLLLPLTHSFQFGSVMFRNDALPAFLSAAGLLLALLAVRRSAWWWLFSGAAFAAAIGVKLSYALPAAAVGLYHVLNVARRRDRSSLLEAAATAAGAALALAPLLVIRSGAPEAFDYGVLGYGAEAPFHWYRANGYEHRLGLGSKLLDTAVILLRGPAWIALALVLFGWWRTKKRKGHADAALLLDLLIVAGLIAALLPTPTWQQYLIPLLPPLYVRLGLTLRSELAGYRPGKLVSGLLVLSLVVGLAQPVVWLVEATRGRNNALSATLEARWMGRELKAAGAEGEIATLSPQVTLDSGYALDRHFANGPFFYRSGDAVPAARQARLNAVSPATLQRHLERSPPAAIVTGYESKDHIDRHNLDDGLRNFARANGYRLQRSPYGDAELYIRP